MRTVVGVDLAGVPARTGVVVITLEHGRAVATVPAPTFVADDASLVRLVGPSTVVGLDAPLGWPDDFVAAISAHQRGEAWPGSAALDGVRSRENLRYRRTDRFVQSLDVGSTPLSVSSDLIGVVAMRAALLQDRWSAAWGTRETRDGSGRVVETYPAAALRVWELLARRGVRYKGGGNEQKVSEQRAARGAIVSALTTATSPWLATSSSLRERAVESDHVLDALVCALVAVAAKAGVTHRVPPDDGVVAAREGWIHVPKVSLVDLSRFVVSDDAA